MRLAARGIALRFVPEGGVLADLAVTDEGREVAPLHRAPWLGRPPADAPVHLAGLQGDFLCAPFARPDGASGMHGWPANGTWAVVEAEPSRLVAELPERVGGARVTKRLEVEDGHPFAYQTHAFEGGEGEVSVANHAMLAVPNGALVRTSPKAFWATPPAPQESDPARGRSALRYPARSGDPRAFPRADGGTADLTTFPWADRAEDFCAGVEAEGSRLGWTAVTRPREGDLFLSLRDARALPMTMLWHSNRGRDYAPWDGGNVCLGVEEGAAAHMLGAWAGEVRPGALALGGVVEVRHVLGAVAWPSGEAVAEVRGTGDSLLVRGEGGATRRVPFRAGFLG